MAKPTQTLATDLLSLTLINKALTLAYELNDAPALSGDPCVRAFNVAREIARASFRVGGPTRSPWAGESIVESAISTGEYEVTDLAGYLAAFRAT